MIANKKERSRYTSPVQQSNREEAPARFAKEASGLDEALFANTLDVPFDKRAAFGNPFQMLSNVKSLVMSKLGLSESAATEVASQVITKSEKIVREYGGDQIESITQLVEELGRQGVDNSDILRNSFQLHPFKHHNQEIQEDIKNRLVSELGMTEHMAENYKGLVYSNAQDLAVTLRPHKREAIAKALVDMVVTSKDTTIIYNIKSSPTLLENLKAQL